MLKTGIIPIINENDPLSTAELKPLDDKPLAQKRGNKI